MTRPNLLRMSRSSLLAGALLVGGAGGLTTSCLDTRNDEQPNGDPSERCATCHGDPDRAGSFLLKAAPPVDTWGSTDTSYPGVGAHSIHLYAGENHAAFACDVCHVVPETTDAPGHIDDDRPAEVVFGDLAKTGDRVPEYHPASRTCTDTWCHRDADAVWTRPRDSDDACGSCHGLPPPLPHPQSAACHLCHSDVIDDKRKIIDKKLHVDGMVEVDMPECQRCHGDETSAAPPPDTLGNLASTAIGVGAHRVHLAGGAAGRALACKECHHVPEDVADPAHIDGAPAEVFLSGVAEAGEHEPSWDHDTRRCSNTWCHGLDAEGSNSPRWTSQQSLGCTDCHAAPPALPHPQSDHCEKCHSEVVGTDLEIIDRLRHVNGVVDVKLTSGCDGCHGSENLAPPVDTRGHTDTAEPGVGAHQTHVLGTARSRAVPCEECHVVPDEVLSPGHVDSALPAELAFSGVATAFGAVPTYENGTCRDSYCHGADFPGRHESGGELTAPSWIVVDGSQAACGSCHGLPPPLPHPQVETCADCHRNMMPDQRSFRYPELHVNGVAETVLE